MPARIACIPNSVAGKRSFKGIGAADFLDWLITTRTLLLLIAAGILLFSILNLWRSRFGAGNRGNGVNFYPNIGFTKLDGFRSVALLLENKSDEPVWTEEVEIALSELRANQQSSEPTCREVHKVRQTVTPTDLLPISLVETIYSAAGRPQRKYSCLLSSVVRFRVGEKWFEEQLPAYRLKMVGLTVESVRPERKAANDRNHPNHLRELTPTSANLK